MIKRKVLLACDNVPGNGGAATAGYRLFQMLRRDGVDASYVNVITQPSAEYLRYAFGPTVGNPRSIDNVHNCFLTRPPFRPDPNHGELAHIIEDLAPDVMVGIDFPAAYLLNHASPERPVVYLTAGCSQLKTRIERGIVRDAMSFQRSMPSSRCEPTITHSTEAETVERSNFILTHSPLNHDLYCFFFAKQQGKISREIIWYADWICDEAREYAELAQPFDQRDIDVLFVANTWDRPEKGWPVVRKIMGRSTGHRVHLVGHATGVPTGVQAHGFVSERESLFALLGRAKTVVSASRFDAAPGILFEASVLGANVVASQNCGNWQLCNQALLANRYRVADFVRCIHRSIVSKFPDQLESFMEARSYEKFVETIAVV